MFQLQDVSMQFNGNYLFQDVSFQLKPGEKVGLAGKNGSGKSTLFKIIAGKFEPESGNVHYPKDYTIGYLSQDLHFDTSKPLLEAAKEGFMALKKLSEKRDYLQKQVEERTDYESDAYAQLLDEFDSVETAFSLKGGYQMDGKAERILKGLGFQHEDFQKQAKNFSGGWQMRIELARLLLQAPDLLLLDEPTNHLDIDAIFWLENFLKTYSGAVMLIAHDEYLLEHLTTRTLEIQHKQMYDYPFPYKTYLEKRKEAMEQQAATLQEQQKEKAKLEDFISRFRYKASKAKQVQSRVKQLEKMKSIEVDSFDRTNFSFHFPPVRPSGKIVLQSKNLQKHYTQKVPPPFDFELNRGEKIAIVGKNGLGKSTFLKMLASEITPDEGKLDWGHNVIPAYYAQHQGENLPMDKKVLEAVEDEAPPELRPKARTILGSMLFSGEDAFKHIKVLSGGEKARLALCRLLLKPGNLLLLDEPTNHLDIQAKKVLKDALMEYEGTLLVVSHDRSFLEGLTSHLLAFMPEGVKKLDEDIDYYLDYLAEKSEDLKTKPKAESSKSTAQKPKVQKEELSFEAQKEAKKAKNKAQKNLKEAENKIASIEKEMSTAEAKLADVNGMDTQKMNKLLSDYENLQKDHTRYMKIWEEAVEKLEGMD